MSVKPTFRRGLLVSLFFFAFVVVAIVGQYLLRGYGISLFRFPHASVPANAFSSEFAFEKWPYLFESNLTASIPKDARYVGIVVSAFHVTKKMSIDN